MAIAVACPTCAWSGKAKDHLAGKRVKCPKCGGSMEVAAPPTRPPDAIGPALIEAGPAVTPRAPAAAPSRPPSRPLGAAEATALVTGAIAPVRTTVGYRVALALVALMMVLLPLVYVALIAGAAWGVWWHLTTNIGMLSNHGLRGRAAAAPFIAYVAPAVVGAVLVLFMVKPLLARRPKEAEPRSLDPADEPALFAFVGAVCRAVGAPLPKRIDVDMHVNASASHRRGLVSLFGNDLVLTIGLPLAAGLSVEQFAGVLAHEFGHFTQGAGMGFGALIDRVNAWFARVVFERDAWDVRLAEWSQSVDIRVGWILWLARGFVWLTRKMLFGLMWIAHAISCLLSRQMEHDADLHQTRLVGAEVVAGMFARLPLLAAAEQKAWRTLGESWVEGVLADDFPGLILAQSERFTAEERESIGAAAAASHTELFATHPADGDRIARARADNAVPIVTCGDPASRLFADFPSLCRSCTLEAFQTALTGKIEPRNLRPVEEVLARERREEEAGAAASRWMAGDTSPHLPFPGVGGPAADAPERCLETVRAARREMSRSGLPERESWDDVFEPLSRHHQTFLIESMVAADKPSKDPSTGVTLRTRPEVTEIRERTWADFETRSRPFADRRRLVDRRLRAALGWLASSGASTALADAAERHDDVVGLSRALDAVADAQPRWIELVASLHALEECFENASNQEVDEPTRKAIAALFERTAAALDGVRAGLVDVPYPLEHADPSMTLARYLVPEPVPAADSEAVFGAANRVRSLFPYLAWQLVGRLVLHAEAAEAAMGLEGREPPPGDGPAPRAATA